MKILVLTGYDKAMESIGHLCAATHRAYAIRHGYGFEAVRDYEPGSHPSWQKLRIITERLPDYDAILWLDADTVITSPFITADTIVDGKPGLHVSTDWTWPMPEDEIKHFSLGNFMVTNHPETFELLRLASLRTEWANCGLWEQQAIQEEYRANEAIRDTVTIHPRRTFNSVPALPHTTGAEPWENGDFLCHMTYTDNAERVRLFPTYDQAALLQIVPNLPEWHETMMCADLRHIACLREILRGRKWKNALEIGVWQGASTAAFMLALDAGTLGTYTGCDVGIQDQFVKVLEKRNKAKIAHMLSTSCLDGPEEYVLIFVYGDHIK